MEDYAFLRGTGAGRPLGVINAGATITVARQAVGTPIQYADLVNMMENFLPTGRGVWVFNQTAFSNLMSMQDPSGWRERSHYAEILRLRAWMLTHIGDAEGAERSYLASLDCAREQQAKSWELRTSTSLARLWRSQGRRHEALDLLRPVYDWFTEGFDSRDLKEARALLSELKSV